MEPRAPAVVSFIILNTLSPAICAASTSARRCASLKWGGVESTTWRKDAADAAATRRRCARNIAATRSGRRGNGTPRWKTWRGGGGQSGVRRREGTLVWWGAPLSSIVPSAALRPWTIWPSWGGG
jgi:hypothetical protein